MVIYVSKKFWFEENRPYGVRPYIRPPLHVSGREMAHFNTICVKLGIDHSRNTITYHNALCLSLQNFAKALSSVSLGS